jgi:hypothetical protein
VLSVIGAFASYLAFLAGRSLLQANSLLKAKNQGLHLAIGYKYNVDISNGIVSSALSDKILA